MAVIKKFGETLTQNLSSFQTYIVDNNPNSTYFKITEFKDSFTGGKNGFLIEGSEHLKETTEIKIQILDVEGNPIYFEPGNGVPEYYEGTSKVVAVYIYEDTPIGTAKITILGELKTYIEEGGVVRDVPDEWKNVYNVKWEKSFQVNRLLSNEDKVRFYRRPKVSISEIVKPIFNNVTTTVVQTGSMSGIAQFPKIGEYLFNYTLPATYVLRIEDSTNWTGSVVGTQIFAPTLGYNFNVDSVLNNKEVLVSNPYTENSLVSNFENEGYTASFNYVEGVNNLKTALTGSFAKIVLTDLTTFIGDVARVKIFRKSQSDLADYQFVQEIRLESNEILRDLESQIKNEEFYGLFDNTNYKNYWATSSNSIVASFNQNYLYNSVQLDSPNSNYFYTTASLGVTENIEYTLTFNTRVGDGSVSANNYLRAFLSGSKIATVNGSPKTVQVEKNIVTITSDNSLLQKNQITANFKAEESNNTKLYFEVKGNDWYISDVSLRASQETAYSPDEITFIQSVPRSLPEETFDYRFEFYDINNNYIPVLVEASKTFNGGNLQKLQKGLVFTPRSLQFQFDSGSNPVPPTVVGFSVTKNLLTGSVTYTSQSFDFDGNELFGHEYTASITSGGGYPGLLDGITSDAPTMTVQHFTGSRSDKTVQIVKITGEVEGFTDTVIFSRVLDGFGGVNHIIRPYRGTQIKNSSTQSLEIQAIRIDGVNDIEISSLTKPEKGWPDKQLHVLSASLNPLTEPEKFINLAKASSSKFIKGLTSGSLGSGEINYNATFNRDSIDTRRTIYLMSSQSAASGPAYITSASVLASIILEDLQDGLDTPVVTYNTDTFNIDPRNEKFFRPTFAFATASFYKRGTTDQITASFQVFPSMSLNTDWVPEYWLYYTTQSVDSTIKVVAVDEAKRIIPAGALNSVVRSPLSQSKNITFTFTYNEPYTSPSSTTASISVDKTFTIVPQGTPGDETIVFEVNPIAITLAANSRGIVNDYKPSITDIRLKQGARYLAFSSSAASHPFFSHGQFYIASSSIIEQNVKAGNIHFTSSFGVPFTASLIVSQSSNLTNLSGSITYPLVIHPYFTSSIYTASVVVNYTKVLDGAPPIQIVISPTSVAIPADEVGYVSSYANANTSITVKEGDDFLLYNTSSLPGTWKINSIETRTGNVWNIRTGSLVTGSASSSFGTFNRFDYPYVSASATYTIQVYPNALGSGHEYTSSVFTRTQTFTKNVSVPNARTLQLVASSDTITYDRDGGNFVPAEPIVLRATAFNTTGSLELGGLTGTANTFDWYIIEDDGVTETPLGETRYYPNKNAQNNYFDELIIDSTYTPGPGQKKTFKVYFWDGTNLITSFPFKAEAQITISGLKSGADAYKIAADNVNTSITADLFSTSSLGTAIKLPTFKGTSSLQNVITGNYPAPQSSDNGIDGLPLGILGFSSASIYSKSPWILLATNRILTNPASMPDIIGWEKPAINKTGEIVYKVEFEGYSNQVATNPINRPPTRATEFVTQSFSVNFTEPAPYNIQMQNDNTSVVYRVSGEIELGNTSNIIRAYRGSYELAHKQSGSFTNLKIDAYGSSSYELQCRVRVSSKPNYIHLANDNISLAYGWLYGNPATMPGITAWDNPETNIAGEIVYEINCEDRQTFYKTQSLSVQFEGNTGPDIVMRGQWNETEDYIGSVETTNQRRDAVIFPDPTGSSGDTHYWAAISGSGPGTFDNNAVLVGKRLPTNPLSPTYTDTAYWQYLGQQDFFVAAKIAIFEESYVKNTINVGTYNNTSKYANIVLAGGRPDPYISVGQHGTVGTGGTSGTSNNPSTAGAAGTSGTGIIGYDRPGIWMGLYEQGASGTYGRLSIKDYSGNNFMKWDGESLILSGLLNAGGMKLGRGVNGANNGLYLNANNYWYDTGNDFKVGASTNYLAWDGTSLILRGALKQTPGGVNEGRIMGPWASGILYYTNDIVTYSGNTWTSNSDHTSTNNTNVTTGYPGAGPWTIAPIAAKLLRLEASSQVFIEAQNGTLSPNYIEFTSNKQNISATTSWTTSPSVTLYDSATGGSVTTTGNTVYLRKADFGSNTLVEVTATADSITDTITVARVQEGTDALTIILTNEAHTLPAASDGTVSSYAGSGTDIYIYEGATQLDYDGVGTAAGKFTVSTATSNITAGGITDGGNYAVVANHSNMTADQATVTYTLAGKKLNGDSFSITKVQSLTKSRAGAAGANGAAGPGISFVGECTSLDSSFVWVSNTTSKMVTLASGTYYLLKNAADGLTKGTTGCPPNATYFETMANFASVATDILLAKDANIYRSLVIGQSGTNGGIIRSANATSLVGPAGGPGFYLQDDGKFRFGNITGSGLPYIYWDNANLTIKGKIVTDNTVISEIGNWRVEQGKLQDVNEFIVLNPNDVTITVNNTSDEKVIEISQANLPAVGGGGGSFVMSTIPGISMNGSYNSSSPLLNEITALDTTGVSISSAGQYKVNSISWGANPFYMNSNGSFSGYLYFEIFVEVWDTANFTGNLIHTFNVGYSDNLGGPFDEGAFYASSGYPVYVTIPSAGTYYFHVRGVVQCYIDSGVGSITGGTWSINTGNTFNKQLSQVNVAGNGFLAAADIDNYVKIERSTSVPLLDVASNSSVPAVRIENAHASAAALEIVDGPLDMSNQNIVDVNTFTWNLANSGYEGTIGAITTGGQTRPSLQLKNIPGSSQLGGERRDVQIKIDAGGFQWWLCRFDSSARFKYDIKDWTHPSLIESINKTPIRTFYWNVDKELENPKKQIGIIAEELEAAGLEEWVDYELEDDPENPTGPQKKVVQSINKGELVFVLWKAVQELSQRVESLEAAISGSK